MQILENCAKIASMKDSIVYDIQSKIPTFRLPRYSEIPGVGLYLEQVVRFVNTYLCQIGCPEITPSMVGNYVKQGTIPGPIKKSYTTESIAYLMFVSVVKSVLPMDDIRLLVRLQKTWYSPQRAYDYFCDEVENVLRYIFGHTERMAKIGTSTNLVKELLRNTIIAVGQQIYLNTYLKALHEEVDKEKAAGNEQ